MHRGLLPAVLQVGGIARTVPGGHIGPVQIRYPEIILAELDVLDIAMENEASDGRALGFGKPLGGC